MEDWKVVQAAADLTMVAAKENDKPWKFWRRKRASEQYLAAARLYESIGMVKDAQKAYELSKMQRTSL